MFNPPDGFQIPEGKKDGDTFSVLAEFKIQGDKLCLTSIDETEIGNDEDDSAMSQTEKTYNEGVDGMMG